jgi:hypothetical protein
MSWYLKLWNWVYKVITLKPATDYFQKLANTKDPQSSHDAINLLWGIGAFFLYFLDHFIYKRVFNNNDFVFIASMAGISTLAAVSAKKVDAKNITTTSDLSQQ